MRPDAVTLETAARLTRHLPRKAPTYALMRLLLRMNSKLAAGHGAGQPIHADVLGFKMDLDPAEFVDCALLLFPHLYDPDELACLRRWLQPGDAFLDAGAYLGLYSLVASRHVGSAGRVVAIEPDPTTYLRLRSNLEANHAANVTALQLGLADQAGLLPLSVNASGQYGGMAANSFLIQSGEPTFVPCRPLLEVLQEQGISQLRGAKFDIEGYEYRVLEQFLNTAPESLRPRFVIVEFHPEWVDLMSGNVVTLLTDFGYRVHGTQALNYIMVSAEGI